MTKKHHPAYRGPWATVRKTILARDNHQCQIRAPKCTGTATQVDHIIPVTKGGQWWDPDNLRASCAHCNNQRIDRKQDDRWQTTNTHITLIVGPPGAGKTTYVKTHAKPGDLIVDYDKIADALGGDMKLETHRNEELHQVTMAARNAILRQLRQGKAKVARAWIISANPMAESMFPFHQVKVVDPGREETKRRAVEAGRPDRWVRLIDDWYAQREGKGSGQRTSSRKW